MFPKVPRSWLTTATVGGGMVGLLLTNSMDWSAFESFVYTLLIAGACVVLAAFVYHRTRTSK